MDSVAMDVNTKIIISIYLRRDLHENGMSLTEYADRVLRGSQPILGHDEFVYQFGAIKDEIILVENWAKDNGLTVIESGSGIATVKVQGTAGQFNNLFKIQLQTVVDGARTYHTHTGTITIPTEIDAVVELILGLDNSVHFKNNAILDPDFRPSIDPNVISSPTPVDLALAYKFPRAPGGDLVQGKGACVAIIELGGGWTTQNLTSTFSRIGQPNPTVVDVSVDGGFNDGGFDVNSSGEVMLDIYCVGAVVPAAKIAMYFAPNTYQGFIDTIITPTNDTVNNPSVISVSWGTTDTNWGSTSRNAFEAAFAAAVVKGITVFIAAGDFGVRALSGGPTYTVQYPGTSPYCICAGGTVMSVNNDYSIASEVPWGTSGGSYAGGGGVSAIFPVPTWQTGFSSKTYPGGTVTSLTGRGIPDVSAHAVGYQFYYGSGNYTGSFVGTSATAPLLAGMMARLNQLSGRRIGFVNSDWYSVRTTAFNDQTTGDNHGGNTVGYMGTAGWDAATGLGSPIGTELYKLYKKGSTFPKQNYGFRPTNGPTYPRLASRATRQ
jgi:kumamolisin